MEMNFDESIHAQIFDIEECLSSPPSCMVSSLDPSFFSFYSQAQLSQTVKVVAMLQTKRLGGPEGDSSTNAASFLSVPVPAELDEPPTADEVKEYAR